jgi:hypothetical protein
LLARDDRFFPHRPGRWLTRARKLAK